MQSSTITLQKQQKLMVSNTLQVVFVISRYYHTETTNTSKAEEIII